MNKISSYLLLAMVIPSTLAMPAPEADAIIFT
jgi:hypothetical protein